MSNRLFVLIDRLWNMTENDTPLFDFVQGLKLKDISL